MDHPNSDLDDASRVPPVSLSQLMVEAGSVVRQMRARGGRRQEASLFVCRKLLYEAGEIPNARLVREISGWGSISDVQEDVRVFVKSLRTSLSAILPESGLPEELQATFARGLAELYAQACRAADARLRDAHDALSAEKSAWVSTEADLRAALTSAAQRQESLDEVLRTQSARIAELEESAKDRQAANNDLVAKLEQLQADLAQSLRDVAAAREDLVEQGAAHARALASAEDRAEARRAPLMLETDGLRQDRKVLEHRLQDSQAQLDTQRTAAATAQGQLHAVERTLREREAADRALRAQLEQRIAELQAALEDAAAREAAALAREATAREDLSRVLAATPPAAPSARRTAGKKQVKKAD
jgi:hypothetical protein